MSDELYQAPSFPLYASDLIADTSHLTAEQFGAYVRLLCRQWMYGGIPVDAGQQAQICGVPRARMRSIWTVISQHFHPHPSRADLLIQQRMERIRDEARRYAEAHAANGAKGAKKRWQKYSGAIASPSSRYAPANGETIANGMAKGMAKNSSPISDLQSPERDLSLRNPVEIISRERAHEAGDRTPFSLAIEFGQWFLARAVEVRVLAGHHAQDPFAWAYRQLDAAEALLAAHGEPECRARAEALFRAIKAKKIRRDASLKSLADVWDWDALKTFIGAARAGDEDDVEGRLGAWLSGGDSR